MSKVEEVYAEIFLHLELSGISWGWGGRVIVKSVCMIYLPLNHVWVLEHT